eukprot:363049-Chlamydomonas_euryale.AAC.29
MRLPQCSSPSHNAVKPAPPSGLRDKFNAAYDGCSNASESDIVDLENTSKSQLSKRAKLSYQ